MSALGKLHYIVPPLQHSSPLLAGGWTLEIAVRTAFAGCATRWHVCVFIFAHIYVCAVVCELRILRTLDRDRTLLVFLV